ncbi:hypothetical protein LVB77_08530 [Lysobacter sp. 5GHs7-4]|uniref:hypothetical protein n=1 Tax=Lysobacter sp. 5GHs7-4 TaxID=2904253 RepID=UPI001E51D477|nr:hypothetical protein [Lysobacter sp. 5GHs7-4]UHQ24716.1 hypothetical protein LVB77_08530 [Lysobacter sp. 5GHs7-4]
MENEENMTFMVQLPADFPLSDLQQIASILEQSDVFVPGYIPPDIGMYHPMGHFYGSTIDKVGIILLPDRNIVSRLAKATTGHKADDQQRLAAAILAFAQCLDIQFEPSIAYHELGPSQGNLAAHEELARFRLADHSHPRGWMDLALGRTDSISFPGDPPIVADSRDLTKPLHRWHCNYIATLKISELELLPLTPLERMLQLLEWMHHDFIVAGPAAIFACHYFAPSFPRKRLLKGLRSEHRERALAGAANAAWDITHLSEFIRKSNDSIGTNNRFVFASLDESLRSVARTLFTATVEDPALERLAAILATWWPNDQSQRIADRLSELVRLRRDPAWYERQRNSPNAIPEFIAQGEARLRAWSPVTEDAAKE